ncbi:MAG: hypothetical protein LBM77_09745 [Spirochaetaceae bacterium]|nr:hypothetical protein [Spirochaetaceae bacterium]
MHRIPAARRIYGVAANVAVPLPGPIARSTDLARAGVNAVGASNHDHSHTYIRRTLVRNSG